LCLFRWAIGVILLLVGYGKILKKPEAAQASYEATEPLFLTQTWMAY
jgi:hypothetical protein